MTELARVVLQDLKRAIEKHSDMLQSEEFRVSWFAITGLLRAVGHVLVKVDAETSPSLKRAVEEKWRDMVRSKPEPAIFWHFIEFERNRFLKNYEHGISRTLTVPGPDLHGKPTIIVVDCANSRGGAFSPGATLESKIADGPFAGRREREIAWKAYDWWKEYLDEVDALAGTYAY
jgi:hypothetical protein